jgi:putative transcriptional regulator
MKNKPNRSVAFQRIKAGLENAIAHAEGRKILTVREVEMPDPPKPMTATHIIALRSKVLGVSQPVFARMLNASLQTVHAWEQGRAKPSGTALRFLRVIEQRPEIIRQAIG